MKTYPCPYCGKKFNRYNLPKHLEKEHDEEIGDDITPYHVAFDIINDRPNHKGKCVICGAPTDWNEKTQKYKRLCDNPKCRNEIHKQYKTRMMKVYGKVYLAEDPEHQKKMLANRRISGKYKWSDGTEFEYCGSYERKLLEFLDDVMDYDSKDIMTPGPTFEYTHNGEKHYWITDLIILPYNLCIDVKDGGKHANKKSMPEYRAKQISKEKMITDQGEYSYLRLTDNDFGQLLSILAELKKTYIDYGQKAIFRIHEAELLYLESVGISTMNRLQQEYFPIKRNYIGRLNDTDVPVYEICEIYPIQKNTGGRRLFVESINEIAKIIRETHPSINIEVTNLNEFDIMDGISLNILTSSI